MPPETVYDLSFVILLSSLIGVRGFYVLTHLDKFAGQWSKIFAFNEGGLTLYGGLGLALLAGWFFCRRRGLGYLEAADIMIPSVALGIGITRIGCFLAGCSPHPFQVGPGAEVRPRSTQGEQVQVLSGG